MSRENNFKIKAEEVAFDLGHRKTINYNIAKYNESVDINRKSYKNIEFAKEYSSNIKNDVLLNLDKYLLEFEENFTKQGGKIKWARNSSEAIKEIIKIINRKKLVVKSKSMSTEEIQFNEALEKNNIESVETDLGEFIVQLAGEKPYHIVTPVMHKSKEQISELFQEKFNTPPNSSPEFLTEFVRKYLRNKFIDADVGVTGANFLVAETGSVCVTENEGNALMSTSFPKIYIAIAGIEKIIPSLKHLGIFWPLLASFGTGQRLTAYNSVFSGPKKNGEIDGPEEMYLILLDNGRTNLYKTKEQYSSLKCIRCGACLNVCPVYQNIGGYTYDTVYSGPIGKVIDPYLNGLENDGHLSFASTLCGKCTEVCPVKIDLHRLLLYNRRDIVKKTKRGIIEKGVMKFLKEALLRRKLLSFRIFGFKAGIMTLVGSKIWGKRRTFPEFSSSSFSKMWKKKYNKIK